MKKIILILLLILIPSICRSGIYGKYDIHQFKDANSVLSLEKAVTRIGSTSGTLEVSSVVTITDPNVILPSTLKLIVTKSGRIDHDPNCELFVNGDFEGGNYTCFGDPNHDWVHFSHNATDSVNPAWFGDVADGVTLCTRAIDRSVASLPTGIGGGGVILLRPGTHLTEGNIITVPNITFKGVDRNTCILKLANDSNRDVILANFSFGTYAENFTCNSLTIDGNDDNQLGTGGWKNLFNDAQLACVAIMSGGYHRITNCILHSALSMGVHLAGGQIPPLEWNNNSLIEGNICYDFGHAPLSFVGRAIQIDAVNVTCRKNTIYDAVAVGISNEETGDGIIITENTIDNCAIGIATFNHRKKAVVSLNNITNCSQIGIEVQRNNYLVTVERVTVSDNIIDTIGNYGILLGQCKNVTVANNQVSLCTTVGIFGIDCSQIIVTGNISKGGSGSGFQFDHGTDITLCNNISTDNNRGMTIGASARLFITNNNFNSNSTYGILMNAGLSDITMLGNTGFANSTSDIETADSTIIYQLLMSGNNFGVYGHSYLETGNSARPYKTSPISLNGVILSANFSTPTSGNWPGRSLIIDSNSSSPYAFLMCTTAGTSGTLNGGVTTGSTTSGQSFLLPSSVTGLTKGTYITIAGVSGIKKVTDEIARLASTTIYEDSNSGQTIVKLTDASEYNVGEWIVINYGGVRQEIGQIRLINIANNQLTLISNLIYTHTAVQADTVQNILKIDSNANATVTEVAIAYSSPTFSRVGAIVP